MNETNDDFTDAIASETESRGADGTAVELLVLWTDEVESIRHAIQQSVLEVADTYIQIGGVRLSGGNQNRCPVPRLVLVELVDHPGQRLAEPTATAVIASVQSLLEANYGQ